MVKDAEKVYICGLDNTIQLPEYEIVTFFAINELHLGVCSI